MKGREREQGRESSREERKGQSGTRKKLGKGTYEGLMSTHAGKSSLVRALLGEMSLLKGDAGAEGGREGGAPPHALHALTHDDDRHVEEGGRETRREGEGAGGVVRVEGSLAYVPQTAWVPNEAFRCVSSLPASLPPSLFLSLYLSLCFHFPLSSLVLGLLPRPGMYICRSCISSLFLLRIRDCVLFGSPYNAVKYQRTLDACCLGPDVARLEASEEGGTGKGSGEGEIQRGATEKSV